MQDIETPTHRVFVYGTLMKGGRNDGYLKKYNCVDKCAVTEEPSYFILQFHSASSPGKFSPGVRKNGQGFIQGEVYEMDDTGLAVLDKLEQNGVRYLREKVKMQDGATAWMYVLIANEKDSGEHDRINFDPKTRIYAWER